MRVGHTDKTFVPAALKGKQGEALRVAVLVSTNYYRVANHLRRLAHEGSAPLTRYELVFTCVTMFVAAFEAYVQERLAIEMDKLRDLDTPESRSRSALLLDLKEQRELKLESNPAQPEYVKLDFKKWIKAVYFFGKCAAMDTSSSVYSNLIALRDLRNAVVHYNPSFIEHTSWPLRLQHALRCSKVDVMNGNWVTTFTQVEVADWAQRTVKEAVEAFADVFGRKSPFDVEDGLPWEQA